MFSPSGEQPKQRTLAYTQNNQLPVMLQYFTNIAVTQSMGVLWQMWLYEIHSGILLICQNATVWVCGAWIRIYYVLCSKTYSPFDSLFWTHTGSRGAARGTHNCEIRLLALSLCSTISEELQIPKLSLYLMPMNTIASCPSYFMFIIAYSPLWGVSTALKLSLNLNPLHAKFFRGNINIYLHFMAYLHIDMTQVLKILPQVRPGLTYSAWSTSWLLMSWRRKEPGHQQPWYWPS